LLLPLCVVLLVGSLLFLVDGLPVLTVFLLYSSAVSRLLDDVVIMTLIQSCLVLAATRLSM
jgi:hypothetical protein